MQCQHVSELAWQRYGGLLRTVHSILQHIDVRMVVPLVNPHQQLPQPPGHHPQPFRVCLDELQSMCGNATSRLPRFISNNNLLEPALAFLFTGKHAMQFSNILSERITRALSSCGKEASYVDQHEVSDGEQMHQTVSTSYVLTDAERQPMPQT